MMRVGCLSSALVCTWVAASAAQATTPKTIWDGVYTAAQSRRGESVSEATCVSCHGEKLSGSDLGPALRGEEFLATWKGLNAAELFEKIRATMPSDGPNTLGAQRYIDVLSYILNVNSFPPGDSELRPDPAVLRSLVITAQKP